jgi:glycerophosphoryl diester phosphodiesterase
VEATLRALILKADAGESSARSVAILKLARYQGFPLQQEFARWLLDADDHVSRAAALAHVETRPPPPLRLFGDALISNHADARANASWALGRLGAPARALLPLLKDKDPQVLAEALTSMARAPGKVRSNTFVRFFSNADPAVRGAAAVALAAHQPKFAAEEISRQLQKEIVAERALYGDQAAVAVPHFSQAEIDKIVAAYRCQMEMIRALHLLKTGSATHVLEKQAFASPENFLQTNGDLAAFNLWNRIGADPLPVMRALASSNPQSANRAKWILVKAGPADLPDLRKALHSENLAVRESAIEIVAWQWDRESLDALRTLQACQGHDAELAAWAIAKIEAMQQPR